MRAICILLFLTILSPCAGPEKKPAKPVPRAPPPAPAFAMASAQSASLRKQRDAIAKQRAALGLPAAENSFFILPNAFTTPADSSFFVLSPK